MVAFAHWRKCDFQIHSCRDPNWTGERPIGIGEASKKTNEPATEAEIAEARETWADALLEACANKELRAIALTDHHETVMIDYVRSAIAKRKKTDPDFDLWLFPGMELTADGGCQCLILFDSGIEDEWLQQAQAKLGIATLTLNPLAKQAPKVTQLAVSYPDISKLLDEFKELRGRYIVLPNMSDGGKHTVLKDGAHASFKRMPYVGGYLDRGQTHQTLGQKNRTRISGTDKTWSLRQIYPIPTSDSRSADFSLIGSNDTWIKLATPTAEAIRQAFLAFESRISVGEPATPSLHISRIKIKGSSIIKDVELELSPELNAAIGGRGSGKSSFLEYLSFGVCKSSLDVFREEYSGAERLSSLVSDTLVSKSGEVSVEIIQDGAAFKIVRGPATAHKPQVEYPSGTKQIVSEKELRSLFPAVVYSQGELAEIGKQATRKSELTDLLQFVNPDYKRDHDRTISELENRKLTLREAITRQLEVWHLQAQLRREQLDLETLIDRIAALAKSLPKLSKEDQSAVNLFDQSSEFDTKRSFASKQSELLIENIRAIRRQHMHRADLTSNLDGTPKVVEARYNDLFDFLTQKFVEIEAGLSSRRAAFATSELEWKEQLATARQERDKVLSKLNNHKNVTQSLVQLKATAEERSKQVAETEARITAADDPSSDLVEAIKSLRTQCDARAKQTEKWAAEIEELSAKKVKAKVVVDGKIEDLFDALDVIAAKTGSKEATRITAVQELLKSKTAWEIIDLVRTECLAITHWNLVGAAAGSEKPKLETMQRIFGASEKVIASLYELMDVARIQQIAVASPNPQISLFYCDDATELSFEKASEGQRASALLLMLLQQPGGPLIVDQPEGDLDNKIISELTQSLHTSKQKRQIFFASHNANIVVNGSSELVLHLSPSISGGREIEQSGAIDHPKVRELITRTMEGGQKAFRDRQDKYGF